MIKQNFNRAYWHVDILNINREVEILINQNPWLKSENEIEYDEDIRKWKGGKRSWIPSIINEISIKPFFLWILFLDLDKLEK